MFPSLNGNTAEGLVPKEGTSRMISEILSNTEILWTSPKGAGPHRRNIKVWGLRSKSGFKYPPASPAHTGCCQVLLPRFLVPAASPGSLLFISCPLPQQVLTLRFLILRGPPVHQAHFPLKSCLLGSHLQGSSAFPWPDFNTALNYTWPYLPFTQPQTCLPDPNLLLTCRIVYW